MQTVPYTYYIYMQSNNTVTYSTRLQGSFSTSFNYEAYPFDRYSLLIQKTLSVYKTGNEHLMNPETHCSQNPACKQHALEYYSRLSDAAATTSVWTSL